MSLHAEALARTTLLLNESYFNGAASEPAIADGLLATTVRLRADRRNLASRGGQAAAVAAFSLIARMGIGVELAIDDVDVIDRVAPLRERRLGNALVELGADLVPGARISRSVRVPI